MLTSALLITPFHLFYGVQDVVDSAVHVWSNGDDPFPFSVSPPQNLIGTIAGLL